MDAEQVTELYRRFGPVVYRRCLRLLGHKEDAQDATQQVFIKLLASQRRFEPLDEALPWMVSVASNHCLNALRDSKRRGAHLEGLTLRDEAGPAPADALEQRQLAQQVLDRADPLSRDIATGVLVAEHGQEDVAKQHGVSDKTVQRRLQKFLANARKYLSRSTE